MAAINEKRVNWRKVAEEWGEEVNTLRGRVLSLERELEAEKARTRRIATRKVFGVTEMDLEEAQCTLRDHINQTPKPRIMR